MRAAIWSELGNKILLFIAEWSVAKVPLYMLLSRCFMIAAGIAVGIGTVGSIGLKKAFSTPPYPKQRLPTKLAGLAFFFGGKTLRK